MGPLQFVVKADIKLSPNQEVLLTKSGKNCWVLPMSS